MIRCAPCVACLLLSLLSLAAALPQRLPATTLVYQSTRDLLHASDLVVVGEVTAVRYEERNGRIVTIVTLKISETWKGQGTGPAARPPGATVEIVEPGGILGDRGSKTGGFPQYKQGDRVVTFLQADPTDPAKRQLRTTGGVAGRHLIVPDNRLPLADPAAQPKPSPTEILARPNADADCDYAGHDPQGRTALVCFSQMMRIEAAQKTTLDQFRAEVAAYQKAFAAGQTPPLSARDAALQKALQNLFDRALPPLPGDPAALPPAGPTLPPARAKAHVHVGVGRDLGPFVVLREEDIDRVIREQQARRQAETTARDETVRNAWILFAVSGVIFIALTVLLRRRRRSAVDRQNGSGL